MDPGFYPCRATHLYSSKASVSQNKSSKDLLGKKRERETPFLEGQARWRGRGTAQVMGFNLTETR